MGFALNPQVDIDSTSPVSNPTPLSCYSGRVKCLCEVSVWRFEVLFLSCACVLVSGVLFSVGVCVCV